MTFCCFRISLLFILSCARYVNKYNKNANVGFYMHILARINYFSIEEVRLRNFKISHHLGLFAKVVHNIYYTFPYQIDILFSAPVNAITKNLNASRACSSTLTKSKVAPVLNTMEQLVNDPHVNKLAFTDGGPEYRFKFDDFVDLETIATTRHIIKKMKHKKSGMVLAVKWVHIPHNRHGTDDENLKKLKQLVREVHNFRELRNEPNIVRFYGFCLYEGQALICMELMDLSLKDLSLKFIENGEKFPEELLNCVIVAVLKALAACKAKNIMHRDVKPDNILLGKNGAIKLIDFGESRVLENSMASTFAGSLTYWPPERFETPEETNTGQPKYDVRADIWSLGITLIEVVSGSVPYRDRRGNIPTNIILLQNLIITLNPTITVDERFNGYSEEIKDFVKSCLRKVKERPKYSDLLVTNFYKNRETIDSETLVKHVMEKYYSTTT